MDIGIADPAWVAADETPRVALAGFEGSLALLVDLARTRQIDLNQLPVADVVDQLMVALQEAMIPLGQKGDWVVLAAWLLLLRSRLLLPVETPEQPDAADMADQLRDRLVAVQAAQALAAWLDQRPQLGHDLFARGQPELFGRRARTGTRSTSSSSSGRVRRSSRMTRARTSRRSTSRPGATCIPSSMRGRTFCGSLRPITGLSNGSCRTCRPKTARSWRCGGVPQWPAR